MRVTILDEHGYRWAMLGLSLPRLQDSEKMGRVANKLAHRDGGHNGFLEFIIVWMRIKAPVYWWREFDAYDVGVSRLSEGSRFVLQNRQLLASDFEGPLPDGQLGYLQHLQEQQDTHTLLQRCPESRLQDRVICTNYKALRNMYQQRRNHWLPEWGLFLNVLEMKLEHPEWLKSIVPSN